MDTDDVADVVRVDVSVVEGVVEIVVVGDVD